ncbi:hypothetical protein [Nocardia bovistercoris]|uniref:Uncharacterized protein n=1 Tax=Nocardia bovistercoris TaxID=2785916 RepID=A0A931IHH4_9NOCA|nr:hypothetical protein [Nocardia bovistercoris]MBH0781872.1 hypothetical protein [Nocardia bovistercoris]
MSKGDLYYSQSKDISLFDAFTDEGVYGIENANGLVIAMRRVDRHLVVEKVSLSSLKTSNRVEVYRRDYLRGALSADDVVANAEKLYDRYRSGERLPCSRFVNMNAAAWAILCKTGRWKRENVKRLRFVSGHPVGMVLKLAYNAINPEFKTVQVL